MLFGINVNQNQKPVFGELVVGKKIRQNIINQVFKYINKDLLQDFRFPIYLITVRYDQNFGWAANFGGAALVRQRFSRGLGLINFIFILSRMRKKYSIKSPKCFRQLMLTMLWSQRFLSQLGSKLKLHVKNIQSSVQKIHDGD